MALIAAYRVFWAQPSAGIDGAVVEPATGISFPVLLRADGRTLTLLGVGVRTKVVVNVYAAAFYAEAVPMRAVSAPFKSAPVGKLAFERRLFAALADAASAKQVVLTFARSVGAQKIADALSAVPGASARARSELEACIVTKKGDLRKGDSLTLSWRGKDSLSVKSGSATLCSFRDRPLAAGLLAMYLGPEAVSPKLKASIAAGIKVLHAPAPAEPE